MRGIDGVTACETLHVAVVVVHRSKRVKGRSGALVVSAPEEASDNSSKTDGRSAADKHGQTDVGRVGADGLEEVVLLEQRVPGRCSFGGG